MQSVFGLRSIVKYWLPVIVWMAFIFIGSTNLLSSSNTERFLVPFLRWLYRGITELGLSHAMTFIRKMGHITEYAILFILVWRALNHWTFSQAMPRFWSNAGPAMVFAALYAVSDEIHQSFYRSRTPSARDVLIDISGAVLGLMLLGAIGCWHRKSIATMAKSPPRKNNAVSPLGF